MDSSVGIATGYRLNGLGIESRPGRDFPNPPDQPLGPASILYKGYRIIPINIKGEVNESVQTYPYTKLFP